jgi:tetratricopeptide (TPR) repeat protein
VKTTLQLNLASCYLKMENWDSALQYCNHALEGDSNNIKAFFRRSAAYEAKKEWEKALADIKKCQELSDVEDKAVTKAAEKIKKEIQKQNEKEKSMWGKAFKS